MSDEYTSKDALEDMGCIRYFTERWLEEVDGLKSASWKIDDDDTADALSRLVTHGFMTASVCGGRATNVTYTDKAKPLLDAWAWSNL